MSSIDPRNKRVLLELERKMIHYYMDSKYHREYIKGINPNWRTTLMEACKYIPSGSVILEVGCGDGAGSQVIGEFVKCGRYVGIDLNVELWQGKRNFVAAMAQALPFRTNVIDVVLSLLVIEHLVFPTEFLDEAWRVLRPGGFLIIIAPDFIHNAMASERVGFTYGSGREKLRQGKVMDALLTAYDTRIRIRLLRWLRKRYFRRGFFSFPILVEPRCLSLPGFVPDCDAVYPVCPEEIINYLSQRDGHEYHEIFYRDNSTFGLLVRKGLL